MRQREEAETLRFARVSASRTEGEGFEPSSDLTARNGFRDRHEHSDLQGFLCSCASQCASARNKPRGHAIPFMTVSFRRHLHGCATLV